MTDLFGNVSYSPQKENDGSIIPNLTQEERDQRWNTLDAILRNSFVNDPVLQGRLQTRIQKMIKEQDSEKKTLNDG